MQVDLSAVIACIEKRQAVINKAQLSLDMAIMGVASLQNADKGQLSFLSHARHRLALANTKACVVLVDEQYACDVPDGSLAVVVKNPYLAYACVSQLFDKHKKTSIHPTAIIDPSAILGQGVFIAPYVVIGANTVIGDNCQINTSTVIGDNCQIGNNTFLDSHVLVADDCVIGDDCRIHAHASIGSEGFGFAPTSNPALDGWERIVQLGRVVIGNRVRIGANTCIDRGTIDDTKIFDDVIIDNLVQIAHNVEIGQGTAIAAKTGIAGSTKIGKGCVIGGAVGIIGHLTIADFVTITVRTLVVKSIDKAGVYSSGTTAMPSHQWKRATIGFRKMGER